MAEFNEALHPRAPKGTENGGEFVVNKEYYEEEVMIQQKKANELRDIFLQNGLYVSPPNTSITDFGVSTYLTYIDIDGVEYKFRISDHSVLSSKRVLSEYHYGENSDINDLFRRFSSEVIGKAYYKNARDTSYKRQEIADQKAFDRYKKLLPKYNYFKDLSFQRYERTYIKPEEFYKKHPNATNVLIMQEGNIYKYEYSVPNKDAYLPNKQPSMEYIRNIDKIK